MISGLFNRNRCAVSPEGIERAVGNRGWFTTVVRELGSLSSNDASALLQGRFRVFKSIVQGKNDDLPDWHTDYHNNHRFSTGKSGKVRINNIKGADCLFPCELSRLQFLAPLILGVESEIPEEERLRFVNRIIHNWRKNNKPGRGVNRRIHMECAIRALALLPALSAPESEYFSAAAQLIVDNILPVIRERISSRPLKRHNHYLIELVCTYLVSDCFQGKIFSEARKTCIAEICNEIDSQFPDEGINFECSISYHRFTVEALLLLYSSLKLGGRDSEEIKLQKKLESILPESLGFIQSYMGTMGRSPQFGDSSDGRMAYSGDYYTWDPLDHRYLITLGRHLGIGTSVSSCYSKSGYAFVKTSLLGVSACASRVFEGYSGHSHMDKLSWTLTVGGNPVFVDPGTWMYNSDPDLRKYFRSTLSHNTVVIDQMEQAEVDFRKAFTQFAGIDSTITCSDRTIHMSHNGYQRNPDLGSVFREIHVSDNSIDVIDNLQGTGRHNVEMGYLIHPAAVNISLIQGRCDIEFQNSKLTVHPPEGMSVSLENRWYSPAYGVRENAERLCFTADMAFPVELNHRISISEG